MQLATKSAGHFLEEYWDTLFVADSYLKQSYFMFLRVDATFNLCNKIVFIFRLIRF